MDQSLEHMRHHPSVPFGTRLRNARLAAGLTQEDLAERAGITPNAIGALERGEHRFPYPATVRALANALALTEDERAGFLASAPKRTRGSIEDIAHPVAPLAGMPAPLSSLIGRERELSTLTSLMQDDGVRLVTLTGPGGVGKTRLAIHVASQLADRIAEGAAFVSLASVRDPALVASTIMQVLGVVDSGSRPPLNRLVEALGGRRVLLVLDNFEHLLQEAALVSAFLAQCRGLSVIVTSRASLRLAGEQEFPVSPLELPDPDGEASIDEVAGIASIRLFAERAHAVDPAFVLTPDNAAAVAAVCQRLDGLPLAIELAAARSHLFAPSAMLPRLARRLPLLTSGRRDAPDRHRTMRDAIAWSYDTLSEGEQEQFCRLSVFVGGFTLAAAEAIGQGSGSRDEKTERAQRDATSVVDQVAALIDNSLLRRVDQAGQEPRYAMLETIREYAQDQLAARGATDAVQMLHVAWCLDLAERAAPAWFSADQTTWGDRLDADHDNLRAALGRSAEGDETGMGFRLAGRLWPYWFVRGHHAEGLRWLERALAWNSAPTIERVRVLTGTACLARCQGDVARSAAWGSEARQIVDAIGAGTGIDAAHVVIGLGLDAAVSGDYRQAIELTEEAMVILRNLQGIEPGVALIEESLFSNLADIAFIEGDDERAMQLAGYALARQRQSGYAWAAADSHFIMARVAERRGDIAGAASSARECLELAGDHRDPTSISAILDQIARLASECGFGDAAAKLLGAATQIEQRLGFMTGAEREASSEVVRGHLGKDHFDAAFVAGQALTIEQAITEALELARRVELAERTPEQ